MRPFAMIDETGEYKISRWLAEFSDRDMEESFQSHMQPIITRQLRIALMVWGILLLLFAIPDYVAVGPTRPFYYLLAYRVVMAMALLILFFIITPETNIFKISYPIMGFVIVYISGFMLFFIYRSDAVYLVIGVLMIQLIALLMFIPIRFIMTFSAAMYGVIIILLTRFALGTTTVNLIALFIILLLPVGVGAVTTRQFGIMQRREFALRTKTEKINLELQSEIERSLKLEATLKELAATDPLTGLYNRREYETLFQHEIERIKRGNTTMCVCIIDLDHFKQVNDSYGHAAGDEVLRRVADIYRHNSRSMDIIGRFGGEEFISLLPETTIDQAAVIGARLLKELAATEIVTDAGSIRITATMGITQLLPDDNDIDKIIHRADDALYKGKEAGRNRVEINMA
jgi:diguanylate cyclase (GGDEF)-like protein